MRFHREACRALVTTGLLMLSLFLAACASMPATGSARLSSGASVAFSLSGSSGPPVVFQSGLGDDRSPWAAVFNALQARHQVFAHDRPGYGASGAPSGARDPCSVAAETHELLAASGLKPPYVLVGHSLGGLYQHAYARLYPDEVAALVLLDPTHPQHWQAMQREAPAAAAAVKALRATVFSAAARREFDDQAQCLERIEGQPVRPVPTRILVSTRFSALEGPEFQRMLGRLRSDWLRLTGAVALVAVPHAGHYLQRDAPQAVVHEIDVAAQSLPMR
jgi:pimeloyl-ACP methyl ester carboxylesterase